jgi:hypothetical protein
MKFLISDRQLGKTQKLADMVLETPNSILVVHNVKEAERVIRHYSIDPHRVIPAGSAGVYLRGNVSEVFIDNVDLILQQMFQGRVEVAAATGTLIH